MSELKLLDDRIKNLTVGLLGLAEGQTMQVGKSFLESVRGYMVELLALRRAQPENSRQHALRTGVCPMCEDCPDGCPIETPHDSRNRQENEPLTLSELRGMGGEPVWLETGEVSIGELIIGCWEIFERLTTVPAEAFWFTRRVRGFLSDNYGKTWLAYRSKPKEEV